MKSIDEILYEILIEYSEQLEKTGLKFDIRQVDLLVKTFNAGIEYQKQIEEKEDAAHK